MASSARKSANIHTKTIENNGKNTTEQQDKNPQSSADPSQASHVSPITSTVGQPKVNSSEDYPNQYYYCNDCPKSKANYESHLVRKHPGKLGYPGKPDLERLGIEAQGKSWEK